MANPRMADPAAAKDIVFGNLDMDDRDTGPDENDRDTGPDDVDEPDDQDEGGPDGDDREVDDQGEDDLREPDDDDARVTHIDDRDQVRERQPRQYQRPEIKRDKQGNLRAPDGAIVARAGREARFYVGMHKARSEVNGLKATVTDHASRLEQAIEIGLGLAEQVKTMKGQIEQGDSTARELGLSSTERVEALQLAHLGKTNPTEFLKKILTRATVAGIDLKSLGLQGGTLDTKSLLDTIKAEIDQRMKPLGERVQRETAEEAQRRETSERFETTKAEVNNFFNANREALPYLPVFMQAMKAFPKMTLGEVWSRIQLNELRLRRGRRSRTRSLPNGRGGNYRQTDANGMASLDADYGEILNGILDQTGAPRSRR